MAYRAARLGHRLAMFQPRIPSEFSPMRQPKRTAVTVISVPLLIPREGDALESCIVPKNVLCNVVDAGRWAMTAARMGLGAPMVKFMVYKR